MYAVIFCEAELRGHLHLLQPVRGRGLYRLCARFVGASRTRSGPRGAILGLRGGVAVRDGGEVQLLESQQRVLVHLKAWSIK